MRRSEAGRPAGQFSWTSLAGGALDVRGLGSRYGVRPLVLLVLLSGFTAFDSEGFQLLSPIIKYDLGLNYLTFFSIVTAISTAALILAGPLGYLADRVRRTVLVGIGGLLSGAGMLATGLATSPITMGMARTLGAAATDLASVPQLSLLVDYYAVSQRVRMLTLVRVGGLAAAVLTLPVIGFLAGTYGWRVPFYLLWMPVMVIALVVIFLLPEPVRGYQERRAVGVADEAASREQPPPSWTESWRLLWSSRVLRYTCYSYAALSLGGTFLRLRTFYFFQVWHQSPGELAAIQTATGIAELVAMLVGGGAINYIARLRPHRVFQVTASFSLVTAVSGVIFVLAPIFWLSVGTSVIFGAVGSLVTVSSTALVLNVMPPRARGTAVGAFAYWALPGLFIGIPAGQLADSYGLQQTILVGSAFPILAAVLGFITAKYYASDVRNAELSAAAAQAHEQRLLEGSPVVLVGRQIDVHYGSVQALFSVDLDVVEGDLLALLGTNGAGKSTLLRTIAGIHQATAGAIVVDGIDITHLPSNEIAARGIVYVQGGRSIFPTLSVRDNLALGSWLRRSRTERDAAGERAFELFPVLRERLDQPAGTLSSGEQQMLALSNALLTRPRLLMIDELSLGLAPGVVDRLIGIVHDINAQGTTVIVVEQSVTVAMRLARRALFMERGTVRFTGHTEELRQRPDLLRAVFLSGGSSMEEASVVPLAAVASRRPRRRAREDGEAMLTVEGIDKRYGGREALSDVGLTLARGTILGVVGPNGAGKTTLIDIISGFTTPDRGSVVFAGEDVTEWSPDRRARQGMVRRFRDARLFPTLTVEEVLTLWVEQSERDDTEAGSGSVIASFRPGRRTRTAQETVDGLIDLMHLERYRESYTADLSTGTRRLVDLAGAIASTPQLLLLDEPAAGMAQMESQELGPILRQLRLRLSCAMVVIEHDIALVSDLADEMVALDLGRVIARGKPRVVLEDPAVVRAYLGTADAARAMPGPPGAPPPWPPPPGVPPPPPWKPVAQGPLGEAG